MRNNNIGNDMTNDDKERPPLGIMPESEFHRNRALRGLSQYKGSGFSAAHKSKVIQIMTTLSYHAEKAAAINKLNKYINKVAPLIIDRLEQGFKIKTSDDILHKQLFKKDKDGNFITSQLSFAWVWVCKQYAAKEL